MLGSNRGPGPRRGGRAGAAGGARRGTLGVERRPGRARRARSRSASSSTSRSSRRSGGARGCSSSTSPPRCSRPRASPSSRRSCCGLKASGPRHHLHHPQAARGDRHRRPRRGAQAGPRGRASWARTTCAASTAARAPGADRRHHVRRGDGAGRGHRGAARGRRARRAPRAPISPTSPCSSSSASPRRGARGQHGIDDVSLRGPRGRDHGRRAASTATVSARSPRSSRASATRAPATSASAAQSIARPDVSRSASGWACATSPTTASARASWRRYSVSINLVLKRIGEAPFWRRGAIDRTAINATARELIDEFDIRTPSRRHVHRQALAAATSRRRCSRASCPSSPGWSSSTSRPTAWTCGPSPRSGSASASWPTRGVAIDRHLHRPRRADRPVRPGRGAVRGPHRGHRRQRPGRRDAHRRAASWAASAAAASRRPRPRRDRARRRPQPAIDGGRPRSRRPRGRWARPVGQRSRSRSGPIVLALHHLRHPAGAHRAATRSRSTTTSSRPACCARRASRTPSRGWRPSCSSAPGSSSPSGPASGTWARTASTCSPSRSSPASGPARHGRAARPSSAGSSCALVAHGRRRRLDASSRRCSRRATGSTRSSPR